MPKTVRSYPIILSAATLILAACATQKGDFPSLSKRPYETENPIEAPESAAPALTTSLPSALSIQTNAWLARSRAADAAFARALPAAQSSARAASGASMGSESWSQAHVQLSRLDATRADSVAALAELDRLIATQRESGSDAGLIALLDGVGQQLGEIVANHSREIARLAATIGR